MTDIMLYHAPFTCGRVTQNALEEAGLEYRMSMVDMYAGGHRQPAYLAINPHGKVPALVVDGQLLTENAAIVTYIDALAPNAGLLPRRDTAWGRARVMSDLIWCTAMLHPMVRQIRAPIRFTVGDTAPVRARGEEYIGPVLATLEARFGKADWWYGATWSILDVYFWWLTDTVTSAEYDMSPYPAIRRHNDLASARPSFQRALAREKREAERAGTHLPQGMQL